MIRPRIRLSNLDFYYPWTVVCQYQANKKYYRAQTALTLENAINMARENLAEDWPVALVVYEPGSIVHWDSRHDQA